MKIPSKPTYSSRTMRHLHWSCCFVEMCVWLLLFIIWVKWHSMSALSVSYVYSGSGNPKKNMTHQFRSLKQEFLGLVTIQIRPLYIFGNKATDGTHGSKYWFPGFGFAWFRTKSTTPWIFTYFFHDNLRPGNTGHSKNWQQHVQYMWKQNACGNLQPPQPLNPTSGGPIGPISVTRSISFTLITWHWNWRTHVSGLVGL